MAPLTRRDLLLRAGLAAAVLVPRRGWAQAPARRVEEDLVAANRILADQGVLDGYGHVSVRAPGKPDRFLMSRSLAPEMVTEADLLEHDLDGNAAAPPGATSSSSVSSTPCLPRAPRRERGGAQSFPVGGSLRRHRHSAAAALSHERLPRRRRAGLRHPRGGRRHRHAGAHARAGTALAKVLGAHPVALMRGHGAVVVATDLPRAVFRASTPR